MVPLAFVPVRQRDGRFDDLACQFLSHRHNKVVDDANPRLMISDGHHGILSQRTQCCGRGTYVIIILFLSATIQSQTD